MSRALTFGLTLVLLAAPYGSGIGSRHILTPLQPIPPSYFGMHIQHTVISVEAAPLTPWPSVTVPEWRLWDARVTWPEIEPQKGKWRFATLDKSVAIAREHNAKVVLTLGFTPHWASARPQEFVGYNPGWAAEPADFKDWRVFVRTVATRYKGRIHIYEIWNEPNLTKIYWTGSTEQMIALGREADQIIKSIDPSAILVSPSATSDDGLKWLSEFLSKGGRQYVDVIGYHFYVFPAAQRQWCRSSKRLSKLRYPTERGASLSGIRSRVGRIQSPFLQKVWPLGISQERSF
jgi:endo-1,4-beta-mannosidase